MQFFLEIFTTSGYFEGLTNVTGMNLDKIVLFALNYMYKDGTVHRP